MELISLIRQLAEKQCSRKCEWVQEDLEKDIMFLKKSSSKCEETGRSMTCLLMLRELGTMCAPLEICLEKNTWPHVTFVSPDYRAPRAETYIIELDAEKHPERWGSGACAFGTIKRIPIETCKQIVSQHSFQYKNQIVRYQTGFGISTTLVDMDLDKDAFEQHFGKIVSIEPEMTPAIQRNIENAKRLLRASAKTIKAKKDVA